MQPEEGAARAASTRAPLRGSCGAPASRWQERPFLPKGRSREVLCCKRRRFPEPGTFKDREIMQNNPHLADRGSVQSPSVGPLASRKTAFFYIPRRVRLPTRPDVLRRRRRRRLALREGPSARGFPGRAHPRGSEPRSSRSRFRGTAAAAGRLHYLRQETALLDPAVWQAGQPAPLKRRPFPGHPRAPLPGPDAYQTKTSRRLASPSSFVIEIGRLQPTPKLATRQARRAVQPSVLRLPAGPAPRANYEVGSANPPRRASCDPIYGLAGRPSEGRRIQVFLFLGARARRCSTEARARPALTTFDSMPGGLGMLRLGADHRRSRRQPRTPFMNVALKLAKSSP